MLTREEASAFLRNVSLLYRMIPYKTTIQNEIWSHLTMSERLDIQNSVKNDSVIDKLAKIAYKYYTESPDKETLFCLSMTIATIIKEYEWGTEFLSADGICKLAQRIHSNKINF